MIRHGTIRVAAALAAVVGLAGDSSSQESFVHWESAHVHPLDLTPDGTRLLAVNTADARLEIFDTSGPLPVLVDEVPVGLDPVSVRARSNVEAWVANHISDSISVIDLPSGRVRATLRTDDEPTDVVFAGSTERAFVTCSSANTVLVFDPDDLGAEPIRIDIQGEDPRALAVSNDGSEVYAAIFESSNGTTILGGGHPGLSYPPQVVNNPLGPWAGVNPPPNSGAAFSPPVAAGLPTPLRTSLIIRQDDNGLWKDDNGGNWTNLVSGPNAALSGRLPGWTLVDNDVAVIDANTLDVSYVKRLMNLCMSLAVNPDDGRIVVVGTDASNEIRFTPNLRAKFVKVYAAVANPASGNSSREDLNPHLDYQTATLPEEERAKSIGDPRAIVFRADGNVGWVAGMGSNNVITVHGDGERNASIPPIDVGEGPTGLALDEAAHRLYVLNKFEASISVIDTQSGIELERVPYFDPTPQAIRDGREYLYDTHDGSGTGHLACASCHPDARMDRLAWDLGDPQGVMKPVSVNNLKANLPSLSNAVFLDYHPMKGPMVTQTLQDIIGKEPFHWRGDQKGIEDFAVVFNELQGDDIPLPPGDMQELEDYLATIYYPPNPYRNLDNSLPTSLDLKGHYTTGRFAPGGQAFPPGNAQHGQELFFPPNFLAGNNACGTCHTNSISAGTDMTWNATLGTLEPIPLGPNGEHHLMLVASDGFTNKSIKVPQLRNSYERTGFNTTLLENTAGFGHEHDGTADSTERHIAQPPFDVTSDQDVADILAFILSISGGELPMGSTTDINRPLGVEGKDTHAAVGRQFTTGTAELPPADESLLQQMVDLALSGKVGLVAKGLIEGESRGYVFSGTDRFDADRLGEILSVNELLAEVGTGEELTFTVVPAGTQGRVGIDRDEDGFRDADEIDGGSDPADPFSVPTQWTDHGGGVAGAHGVPFLFVTGPLVGNAELGLTLVEALENTSLFLVAGLSELGQPFKGGTLVPNPDVLIFGLSTSGYGTFSVEATLPPSIPSGMTLVLQAWLQDPAGVQGFAASRGLSATAP